LWIAHRSAISGPSGVTPDALVSLASRRCSRPASRSRLIEMRAHRHQRGTLIGGGTLANPGTSWKAIGTGDFNGDGNADILLQTSTEPRKS
jgi:hypothetical protein